MKASLVVAFVGDMARWMLEHDDLVVAGPVYREAALALAIQGFKDILSTDGLRPSDAMRLTSSPAVKCVLIRTFEKTTRLGDPTDCCNVSCCRERYQHN